MTLRKYNITCTKYNFFILIIFRKCLRRSNWNFSKMSHFVSNDSLDWTSTKIWECGRYWSELAENSRFYSRSNSDGLHRLQCRSLRNFGWDHDMRDRNARASIAHVGVINLNESFRIFLPCRTRSRDSKTRRKFSLTITCHSILLVTEFAFEFAGSFVRSLKSILTIGV